MFCTFYCIFVIAENTPKLPRSRMAVTINSLRRFKMPYSLSWNDQIDHTMFKLGRACYAITYVKQFMSQDTLRTTYFPYVHFILSYGIIFFGNSAYSSNIFKIHKRIIRIIMNARN